MVIQTGDTGPAVTALQDDLVALGFPLASDGVFGVRTGDAVRGFQLVTGLVVDELVGPQTQAALAAGTWNTVNASATLTALRRIERTNSVTTAIAIIEATADVRWPEIAADAFATPAANDSLTALAEGLVADTVSEPEPVSGVGGQSFVDGELEATLLAASLLGVHGNVSEFTSGAAHPNPRPVTITVDAGEDRLLQPDELFMAGTDWRAVIQELATVEFPSATAAGLEPTVENYQHLTVTPTGIKVVFKPFQILPGAAGAPEFVATWADVASVVRPSVVARSIAGSPGGPGPHLS